MHLSFSGYPSGNSIRETLSTTTPEEKCKSGCYKQWVFKKLVVEDIEEMLESAGPIFIKVLSQDLGLNIQEKSIQFKPKPLLLVRQSLNLSR